MTNAIRLTVGPVIAIMLVFQLVIAGSRLPAAENKHDSASQLPFPSAKQLQQIVKTQAETWQLHLRLDMPAMDPQAVQFAILDHDPAPAYKTHIKQMRKSHLQQLDSADTKPWKDQIRFILMKIDWDSGFASVTGVDLFLLTNSPRAKSSGTVLSSTEPAGKKWIVTKCVDIDGRPYCWSIPVELKIGKPVFVTLDKSNTFDLQRPYDAAMNEPNPNADKPEPKK
jgi:hypothetical protein